MLLVKCNTLTKTNTTENRVIDDDSSHDVFSSKKKLRSTPIEIVFISKPIPHTPRDHSADALYNYLTIRTPAKMQQMGFQTGHNQSGEAHKLQRSSPILCHYTTYIYIYCGMAFIVTTCDDDDGHIYIYIY